jgi:hypothetical protein
MRGNRQLRPHVRHPVGAVALVGVAGALLLASCSSSPAPQARSATTTTTAAASASSTSTTTTLPAASTSGPLSAGAPIALPFAADRVTAAESPDGAAFAAPQDPTSPTPAIVWVVDGNGPAAIAEHMPGGVAALAADAANLYVASYANVTAFDRTSGNQGTQWTLPAVHAANSSDNDLVAMTAAGGLVFVSITQGNTVTVYSITPSSSAPPRKLVAGLGAAVGPDGSIYYETTGHSLAVRRPDGTTKVGPALAAAPNAEGGGVQYIDTFAGGAVWASEPAGQGLDAQFATYDGATLNALGSFGGNVNDTVVDTQAGPLVLAPAANGSCPATPEPSSCVLRTDVHGAMSDAVGVGQAVLLTGPAPAVVVADTATSQFDLIRLS